MSSPVLAVDLGGTKLAVALVTPGGEIARKVRVPVQKESFEGSLQQVLATCAQVQERDPVAGMGVCVPGIYYTSTGNAWAPNLWGWDEVPLRDALQARAGTRVTIDSDRAAYVLGEQWLGAARGLSDVIFLALGTGIGAGILSGGRLIRGAHGIAGAVGWFALSPTRQEIYKQMGCFEAEAAGPAVARRAQAATTESVVEAARRGDALARNVLAETAEWIGMGVANLISAFNPEMVVLGGGLMQAADLLLDAIRREALEWAQPIAARRARIELSTLGEDAGLLGAARLALQ